MSSTTTAAVVTAGSFLTLHYRLAGPAGDIINTFADKPATLSLGTGELSPAMEQRLIGLEEGTHATFELPAGEAFGERNPEMQQWVARKLLAQMGDPDEQYAVGDVVQFPTPDGTGSYAGAVIESNDDRRALRLQPSARRSARDLRGQADRRAVSARPRKSSWPSRAASAPASTAPSRSSSAPSPSSARRSTCATRSCTTPTW